MNHSPKYVGLDVHRATTLAAVRWDRGHGIGLSNLRDGGACLS
jgi:hypothetical protein